jgi:hypothetical protein
MVGDAVSEVTKATRAANGATQVFPQPRTQLVLKPGFPVFRGKHQVIEKAGIGLGHEETPLRFRHPCGVFEGLWRLSPRVLPQRRSFTLGYTPPPLPGLYASYLVSNSNENEAQNENRNRPRFGRNAAQLSTLLWLRRFLVLICRDSLLQIFLSLATLLCA